MKIYNHEKNTSLLSKNYDETYVLLGLGVVGIGLGIYFLIVNNLTYGLILLGLALVAILLTIKEIVLKKKNEKSNNLYIKVFEDIKNEKIKEKLGEFFDLENIDYIITDECLMFGVLYDENCYFNATIKKDKYSFSLDLTDKIYEIDEKIMDECFPEKIFKLIDNPVTFKSDENTYQAIYKRFNDFTIKHQFNIKEISDYAKKAFKQSQNVN